MIEYKNNLDVAYFETNEHGRLLSGNVKFCRMFGFLESEIIWHYISDLCRYEKEWESFRDCSDNSKHYFIIRMRNRKGRSFKCSVTREIIQDSMGKITYRNFVRRINEIESMVVPENSLDSKSVVFIVKCAHCNTQIRVNTLAQSRMKMLCNECAFKSFPEAFTLKTAQV